MKYGLILKILFKASEHVIKLEKAVSLKPNILVKVLKILSIFLNILGRIYSSFSIKLLFFLDNI